MTLQKDIREFIELLLSHKVEFVLVGGYALAHHGAPRFTEDIDFFILTSLENTRRLEAVVNAFGFGDTGLTQSDFLEPDQVIQLGRAPNRIDILTGISGVSWQEAWGSKEAMDLDGLRVWVLGREALIRNKRTSGRPQDLADAARLEQGPNR